MSTATGTTARGTSTAVAAAPAPAAHIAVNPWLIAVVVVIPTFMEVLDTTVANVSLRYIAGGLSAAQPDAEWVITSYLAANAIIVPISGWLGVRLGRRNYFLLSIALFTISSALCGMATSLWQIILFRAMQGVGGGGLQPSSQGILLDSFPAEKQGSAMTLFGVAALFAPIIGPTLGGWITVDYDWRWIFYINVPVGLLALAACYYLVEDPEYLKKDTAEAAKSKSPFDGVGLALLVIAMAAWEVMLSKGQQWDWSGDPFWRVQTLACLFVFGLIGLVLWETHHKNPIINFLPLLDRNFASSCLIIFSSYAILLGASTLLPGMLQSLFGYDALASGIVMSPSGIGAILLMPVVGVIIGRQVDARWLIAAGLIVLGTSNYWMSQLNLSISPWQVVWPRVVMIAGLSMLFAPLNVAAFIYVPREMRGAAVGLFALLRNEGGSVGTSLAQTFEERRQQFHTLRLNESLNQLQPAVQYYGNQVQNYMMQKTGDKVLSRQMAEQLLSNARDQQAASLAYFDCFLAFGMAAFALVFLVLLMKRSVAEKGAHLSGE
jgi:DHA2 family multidrug resistance protein